MVIKHVKCTPGLEKGLQSYMYRFRYLVFCFEHNNCHKNVIVNLIFIKELKLSKVKNKGLQNIP